MNYIKIIVLIFSIGFYSAQVGINTDTPDPSAILDLGPGNKGILLPHHQQKVREFYCRVS